MEAKGPARETGDQLTDAILLSPSSIGSPNAFSTTVKAAGGRSSVTSAESPLLQTVSLPHVSAASVSSRLSMDSLEGAYSMNDTSFGILDLEAMADSSVSKFLVSPLPQVGTSFESTRASLPGNRHSSCNGVSSSRNVSSEASTLMPPAASSAAHTSLENESDHSSDRSGRSTPLDKILGEKGTTVSRGTSEEESALPEKLLERASTESSCTGYSSRASSVVDPDDDTMHETSFTEEVQVPPTCSAVARVDVISSALSVGSSVPPQTSSRLRGDGLESEAATYTSTDSSSSVHQQSLHTASARTMSHEADKSSVPVRVGELAGGVVPPRELGEMTLIGDEMEPSVMQEADNFSQFEPSHLSSVLNSSTFLRSTCAQDAMEQNTAANNTTTTTTLSPIPTVQSISFSGSTEPTTRPAVTGESPLTKDQGMSLPPHTTGHGEASTTADPTALEASTCTATSSIAVMPHTNGTVGVQAVYEESLAEESLTSAYLVPTHEDTAMDHEDTQTDYSLASSLNELAGTLGSTLTEEEQEAQLMESKISSLRETLNEMASKTREGLYNPFDSDDNEESYDFDQNVDFEKQESGSFLAQLAEDEKEISKANLLPHVSMSFDQDTFNSGEVSVGDYFGARSCNVGKLTSNKQNPNERPKFSNSDSHIIESPAIVNGEYASPGKSDPLSGPATTTTSRHTAIVSPGAAVVSTYSPLPFQFEIPQLDLESLAPDLQLQHSFTNTTNTMAAATSLQGRPPTHPLPPVQPSPSAGEGVASPQTTRVTGPTTPRAGSTNVFSQATTLSQVGPTLSQAGTQADPVILLSQAGPATTLGPTTTLSQAGPTTTLSQAGPTTAFSQAGPTTSHPVVDTGIGDGSTLIFPEMSALSLSPPPSMLEKGGGLSAIMSPPTPSYAHHLTAAFDMTNLTLNDTSFHAPPAPAGAAGQYQMLQGRPHTATTSAAEDTTTAAAAIDCHASPPPKEGEPHAPKAHSRPLTAPLSPSAMMVSKAALVSSSMSKTEVQQVHHHHLPAQKQHDSLFSKEDARRKVAELHATLDSSRFDADAFIASLQVGHVTSGTAVPVTAAGASHVTPDSSISASADSSIAQSSSSAVSLPCSSEGPSPTGLPPSSSTRASPSLLTSVHSPVSSALQFTASTLPSSIPLTYPSTLSSARPPFSVLSTPHVAQVPPSTQTLLSNTRVVPVPPSTVPHIVPPSTPHMTQVPPSTPHVVPPSTPHVAQITQTPLSTMHVVPPSTTSVFQVPPSTPHLVPLSTTHAVPPSTPHVTQVPPSTPHVVPPSTTHMVPPSTTHVVLTYTQTPLSTTHVVPPPTTHFLPSTPHVAQVTPSILHVLPPSTPHVTQVPPSTQVTLSTPHMAPSSTHMVLPSTQVSGTLSNTHLVPPTCTTHVVPPSVFQVPPSIPHVFPPSTPHMVPPSTPHMVPPSTPHVVQPHSSSAFSPPPNRLPVFVASNPPIHTFSISSPPLSTPPIITPPPHTTPSPQSPPHIITPPPHTTPPSPAHATPPHLHTTTPTPPAITPPPPPLHSPVFASTVHVPSSPPHHLPAIAPMSPFLSLNTGAVLTSASPPRPSLPSSITIPPSLPPAILSQPQTVLTSSYNSLRASVSTGDSLLLLPSSSEPPSVSLLATGAGHSTKEREEEKFTRRMANRLKFSPKKLDSFSSYYASMQQHLSEEPMEDVRARLRVDTTTSILSPPPPTASPLKLTSSLSPGVSSVETLLLPHTRTHASSSGVSREPMGRGRDLVDTPPLLRGTGKVPLAPELSLVSEEGQSMPGTGMHVEERSGLGDHHTGLSSLLATTLSPRKTLEQLDPLALGSLAPQDQDDPLQSLPLPAASANSVSAPSVLSFKGVCCVGGTLSAHLHLTNSGQRWIQATPEVTELYRNDTKCSPGEHGVFELPARCFVGSHQLEPLKINFRPEAAGSYRAVVTIRSSLVVGGEDPGRSPMPPCTLTLMALCEEPQVKVLSVGQGGEAALGSSNSRSVGGGVSGTGSGTPSLDFGVMAAGCSRSLCLRLLNCGTAPVPLRMTITCTTFSQFCFSFGELTSGLIQPLETSLISLPTSIYFTIPPKTEKEQADHSVTVNFKAPRKYIEDAAVLGLPEEITAHIVIEVEGTKRGPLHSVPIKATVGVARLHTPRSLMAISFSCKSGETVSKLIPLKNAGNIPIDVQLKASLDCFSVTPNALHMDPNEESEVNIRFSPSVIPQTFEDFLMIHVQPVGPDYEIKLRGITEAEKLLAEVEKKSAKGMLACNKRALYWGGVQPQDSELQKLVLHNSFPYQLPIRISIREPGSPFEVQCVGEGVISSAQVVTIGPKEQVSLHVVFTPSATAVYLNALDIHDTTHNKRYKIPLCGYGGTSCVKVLNVDRSTDEQGFWVNMRDMVVGQPTVLKLTTHNCGERPAFVRVLCCPVGDHSHALPKTRASVSPDTFILPAHSMQELQVLYHMSQGEGEGEGEGRMVEGGGGSASRPLAQLLVCYGDELIRQRFLRSFSDKKSLQSVCLPNQVYLVHFPGQETVPTEIDLSLFQVEDEEKFFQLHLNRVVITLSGSIPHQHHHHHHHHHRPQKRTTPQQHQGKRHQHQHQRHDEMRTHAHTHTTTPAAPERWRKQHHTTPAPATTATATHTTNPTTTHHLLQAHGNRTSADPLTSRHLPHHHPAGVSTSNDQPRPHPAPASHPWPHPHPHHADVGQAWPRPPPVSQPHPHPVAQPRLLHHHPHAAADQPTHHHQDHQHTQARHSVTSKHQSWNVEPSTVNLFLQSQFATLSSSIAEVVLINNSDSELHCKAEWPKRHLVVTPEEQILPPRSRVGVVVSSAMASVSSSPLFPHLLAPPWTGEVTFHCAGRKQVVKVQVHQTTPQPFSSSPPPPPSITTATLPLVPSNTPLPVRAPLGPTPTPTPLSSSSIAVVDSRSILFPTTLVGHYSEKFLEIHNPFSQPMKWQLASVASAFVRDTEHGSSEIHVHKITYSVFWVRDKLGTILPQDSAKVLLTFQPRNQGSFSQIWDLQIPSSDGDTEKIRLSIGGKATFSPVHTAREAPVSVTLTTQATPPAPAPGLTPTPAPAPATSHANKIRREPHHHLLSPTHLHRLLGNTNITTTTRARARTRTRAVYLETDSVEFPATRAGERAMVKVKVVNKHSQPLKFSVIKPHFPFKVDHSSFELDVRMCARYPIYFCPVLPGKHYSGILAMSTSAGHQVFATLKGKCI